MATQAWAMAHIGIPPKSHSRTRHETSFSKIKGSLYIQKVIDIRNAKNIIGEEIPADNEIGKV